MTDPTNTEKHVDVVIVGAGPAGCAAAIQARRAGLRVLIFDADAEPRVAPGETFHPGMEPLLKQLGVLDAVLEAGFPRHRGIWVDSGDVRHFMPYGEDADGPWLGFQADRRMFHQILQEATVDAKARLMRDTRAETLLMEGNRVAGVLANGEAFRARWTVDATGRAAWLAKELRLSSITSSPPLGARFGWSDEELAGLDAQPSFAFRPDGWDWRARLGHNRTAWVELRIGERSGRRPPGIDLTWRFCPECAGPGYFLLGDAAATLDPSSSHGVLRALLSGILFGHLIESCYRTTVSEAAVIDTYREFASQLFEHDERAMRDFYANSVAGRRFLAETPTTEVH